MEPHVVGQPPPKARFVHSISVFILAIYDINAVVSVVKMFNIIITSITCITCWICAVAGAGAVVGVAAGATVAAVHVALTSTATYDEFTTCEPTTTATW